MTHDPGEMVTVAGELNPLRRRYYKWDYLCKRYERGKNAKLGQIIQRLRGEGGAKRSAEETKSLAYADASYAEYLREWENAEKEKIKAQIEYENKEVYLEALRSFFAFERDAMRQNI